MTLSGQIKILRILSYEILICVFDLIQLLLRIFFSFCLKAFKQIRRENICKSNEGTIKIKEELEFKSITMQKKKENDWTLEKAILKSSSSTKQLSWSSFQRKCKLYMVEQIFFFLVSHRLIILLWSRQQNYINMLSNQNTWSKWK